MLTVLVAAAVLLALGWALGRAPLFRLLIFVLVPVAFLALVFAWYAFLVRVDLHRFLRSNVSDLAAVMVELPLLFLPPLLLVGFSIRRVRRRGWPSFVRQLAERPALLSLPRILLVQAAAVVVWIAAGNIFAGWRERQAEEAWRHFGQPLEAQAARYPKGPTNPAGLELQRLAKAVGIAVRPDDDADSPAKAAHDRVREAMSAYVFGEAKRTLGPAAAPPLEVRAWLAMSATGLDALEQQLLSRGPIVWETDIHRFQTFPLAGLRDLHLALLTSAFEAMGNGQAVKAKGRLEAAWQLTTSLREGPSTSARLLSLMQDRHWLGGLRAGAPATDESLARLEVLSDPVRPLGAQAVEALSFLDEARGLRTTLRGMYLESNWLLTLLHEQPQGLPGALFLVLSGGRVEMEGMSGAMEAERARAQSGIYRLLQGPLERPYLRLCAADYANALAAACAKARDGRDACAPLPSPDHSEPRLAPWSLVGEGAVAVDRLAHAAALLRAEAELTRLVLRARTLRTADPKHGWPGQLPGLDSVVCQGRRWVYAAQPDGSASVRLEGSPFFEREATVAFRMSER